MFAITWASAMAVAVALSGASPPAGTRLIPPAPCTPPDLDCCAFAPTSTPSSG